MKRDIGKELLEGIKAIKQGRGRRITTEGSPDAKTIREKTGLSQSASAELSDVSDRTLHEWEKGRDPG